MDFKQNLAALREQLTLLRQEHLFDRIADMQKATNSLLEVVYFDGEFTLAPVSDIIVPFQDSYVIRTDPEKVETNYILGQDEQREFIRGDGTDNQFVDERLDDPQYLIAVDWDEPVLRFPDLPNGSRINGLDGYDEVHVAAPEAGTKWMQLIDVEYVRVDFGNDRGGEVFGPMDMPEGASYLHIDADAGMAAIYDDGFNFVDM